jgi:plasmid maintenance system antidote protein VapI
METHNPPHPGEVIREGLERAGWSTAGTLLRMQTSCDLWHARQRPENLKVKPFATLTATA